MSGRLRVGVNTLFMVPGDVGGSETYLRQSLRAMASARPDVSLLLFTSRDNHNFLRQEYAQFQNVDYQRLHFRAANRPLRIILEQLWLPAAVLRSGVDVLWSPGYTAPLLSACPQAVTIHDLQYKSHPEDLSFLERRTLNFLVQAACSRCKSVITVSEFARQEILRYGFAPAAKVFAVHEGVAEDFAVPAVPDRQELKRGPGGFQPDRQPYILCVAHTYPHKNVHLLVDALRLAGGRIPHHLVLVGSPRRGEAALEESLARFAGSAERFHRLQGLSRAELIGLYRGAACFVLPSAYEGFGLPVLEAMMAGTPVVTTRMASIPEVGGPHAIYLAGLTPDDLARNIIQVLHMEPAARKEHVRRARQWAASFTWSRSARQTLEILTRLARR